MAGIYTIARKSMETELSQGQIEEIYEGLYSRIKSGKKSRNNSLVESVDQINLITFTEIAEDFMTLK